MPEVDGVTSANAYDVSNSGKAIGTIIAIVLVIIVGKMFHIF